MSSLGNSRKISVHPSLLSADFSKLRDEIQAVEAAGANGIHIDVMDGHFVNNITIGSCVCESIRQHITTFMEVHLMVQEAYTHLERFANAGADTIIVHAETEKNLHASLLKIRQLGCKAGIALNPETSESVIRYLLDSIDFVCVMTVNPGSAGQPFLDTQIQKICAVRKITEEKNIKIIVDGGVNPQTAIPCIESGADILVAGSSIFTRESLESLNKRIQRIRGA
jgi:ribulose-phosphate 3-epimerase